jgi:hypothetical protein
MPKAGGAADEGIRAAMQRSVPHAYRFLNTSREEVVTRTDQAFDQAAQLGGCVIPLRHTTSP